MPKKDLNQIAANIAALTTGTKVKEEAERLKKKQQEKIKREAEEGSDQEGVIDWKYPFKGKMLRIETPEDITSELWNKLQRYIEVLKPD